LPSNESHNIPRLFASVEGCFDEIVFVDTGSTDNTIETAKAWAQKINTPIKIEYFAWINDFAAARNYSFDHCTTDFIAWMDIR